MAERKPTELLIRDTLIEMMSEMPFSAIRVKDLVERAHVNRSTFYAYYDSLYSVLQQIEDDFFAGFDGSTTSVSESRRSDMPTPIIVKNLEYFKENAQTLQSLLGNYGDPAFQARFTRLLCLQLEKFSPGLKNATGKSKVIRDYIAAGQLSTLKILSFSRDELDSEELAQMVHVIASTLLDLVDE